MKHTKWIFLVLMLLSPFLLLSTLPFQRKMLKTDAISAVKKTTQPVVSLTQDTEEATSPAETTEVDREQARVLDEILKSRDDNDPRLDTELRTLAPGAKMLLRARYAEMPRESLNERGTIVFLLGRNLTDTRDFGFLDRVLAEPRCLSLADCSHPPDAEDEHSGSINAVTASYHQLNALKAVEKFMAQGQNADPKLLSRAKDTVSNALRSENSMVVRQARSLAQRFHL